MNILPSEGITFKQLERIFFEIGCDVARTLMEQYCRFSRSTLPNYVKNNHNKIDN